MFKQKIFQSKITYVYIVLLAVLLFILVRENSNTRSLRALNTNVADVPTRAKVYTGSLITLSGGLTRNKKALLFGLNYTNTPYRLFGCIQDVSNLRSYLQGLSYSVTMFTDATVVRPTMQTMKTQLTTFLGSLGPNDTAFIWFSGHGTLMSGNVNAWVPLDFQTQGFLPESFITPLLRSTNSSARVVIGSDSCYSGSMANLRYDLEPTLASRPIAGRGLEEPFEVVAKTVVDHRSVPEDHGVPHTRDFLNTNLKSVQNYRLYDTNQLSIGASVLHISGCRDNQTSADAYIDAATQGAMTWSFLKSIRTSGLSVGQLQDLMRASLKSKRFSQVPQFSLSSPINATSKINAFGLT